MGVCLCVAFDKKSPGAEFQGEGYALAACLHRLDRIAKQRGLALLSNFAYDDQAAAKLPEGQVLEETWYDPHEGLRTVTGLINALEAPDRRAWKQVDRGGILAPIWRFLGIQSGLEGKWAETVLAELKEMQRCLQLAAERQSRFFFFYF